MTTYAYIALEPSGKKKTGFVDATNREAAMAVISAEGRFVLEIKEQSTRATVDEHVEGKRRGAISRSDLALFTRRLSDLSAAGLPLDRTLQVVAEQSESAALSAISEHALEEVRGGKAVSDALAAYPKYFPQVYTQTLKAGEASGQFPEVTARLADFQENEVQRRSQITSALVYPIILSVTAVLVMVALMTFVIPKLSPIFVKLGSELPVTTKMMLATADFMTHNYLAILITLACLIAGYKTWAATEPGALARDRFLLHAPAVGPIVRKATVSRFARVLGTLLYGGVPILTALDLAGLASGNKLFMHSTSSVLDDVREGRPVAEAMRDTGAFPPVLTHMVAIGEETGDLPKMLARVSDSLDFEVDNGLRRFVAMFEPLMVLAMAVMVGFIVVSILLPIYQAGDTIK
jgi:type IV pilus assembly protein PilC